MAEHTALHTPLPWSIGDNPNSQYGCEIVASTKVKARRVVCRLGGPDREANAALIVRAINTSPAVADLVKVLEECRSTLAMLTEPKEIRSSSVQHAWAHAVEAERKARSALSRFRELEKGNG